jgi:hypothetical protein
MWVNCETAGETPALQTLCPAEGFVASVTPIHIDVRKAD